MFKKKYIITRYENLDDKCYFNIQYGSWIERFLGKLFGGRINLGSDSTLWYGGDNGYCRFLTLDKCKQTIKKHELSLMEEKLGKFNVISKIHV